MPLDLKNNYNNFSEYLNDAAPKFLPYLVSSIDSAKFSFENDKHADLENYLYGPLKNYSKNPGKMHRPLTFLATYLSCGGSDSNIDDVIPIACSIENFQTAALVHDDIADDGKIRRGKPCMHLTEGLGVTINVGDLGLSMTVGNVVKNLQNSNYSDKKILNIIEKLIMMQYMTIEGQALDLGWARDGRFDISLDDYICMATKKSAYYSVALPAVIAAICADSDNKVVEGLQDFGKKVGLAFQIQDDILNLVETPTSKNQKDFRSDITEGKRTLIVAYANDLCDEKNKLRLVEILKSHESDSKVLSEAVKILESCGAIKKAQDFAKQLSNDGSKILSELLPASLWKDLLLDMCIWAVERGY